MKTRTVLGALACTALLASVGLAQDTPAPAFTMTTLEHTPSTMGAWRNAEAQVVEALKAANIPAAEVGWWAYVKDNKTMIVRPRSRDALFGGGGQGSMARLRAAAPEKAAEIQKAFEGTQLRVVSSEVFVQSADLSYASGMDAGTQGGAQVVDVVVAPGQGAAFNEAIQAINKVRADLKYPYNVQVYRVRIGEPRTMVVTFFDSAENFFGKNSLDRLAAGNSAAQAALGAAFGALINTVSSWDSKLTNYAAAMSYPPM
jgi:hypothetical protein